MRPVYGVRMPSRGGVFTALAITVAIVGGCESALDQDRDELGKLRETIGSVSALSSKSAILPLKSNPDLLAKMTKPSEQEEQLQKIVEVLKKSKVRELSIAECRQLTLTNNLNLQAQFISPQIAEQQVRVQQAKFESSFELSVTQQKNISPAYNYGAGSGGASVYGSQNLSVVPTLQVPLRTGGAVSLDWSVDTSLTESTGFSEVATTTESDISLEIQQPLLRGGWWEYNEASIILAESIEGQASADTQMAVVQQLLNAEEAYWDVYMAWRTLEINLQIYEKTKSILSDARELVRLNQGSISSVYNFEVTLSQRVQAVIGSELSLRLKIRALKATVQDPTMSLDSTLSLKPSSKPRLISYEFDRMKLVRVAISNRAELLKLEFEQVSDAISILMAKNQMLPDLTVMAGYTWNGINSTSRSATVATRNLFKNNIQGGWEVGLTASVPLGNEAAIAAYQGALLMRLQSIANTRAQEILVTQEVLDSVDSLEGGWEMILTSRYQVAAAQRNLDAMNTLFQNSERTSTDLANAINLLAGAQTTAVGAESNYQIDLANLAGAIGCMLGHAGIEWGDYANLGMLESDETLPPPIMVDEADVERSELPAPSVVPNPVDVDVDGDGDGDGDGAMEAPAP